MDFVVRPRGAAFEPNADVFVDDDREHVLVKVEVAGADPESLRVVVHERRLVITGHRSDATRLRRGSFAQKEIAYGDFAKSIYLPVAVEFESVVAEYDDGVLVIALPISATEYIPTARTEIRMIVRRTLA